MSRAQSGVEFIIIFGFVFLVFVIFFTVIESNMVQQQQRNSELRYAQVADLVEQEVLLAARVATGYRREFFVPHDLDGEPYNLTLEDNNTLIVRGNWTGSEYLRFFATNVSIVSPSPADRSILIVNSQRVILQRNATGLVFRKDCVQLGRTLDQCV